MAATSRAERPTMVPVIRFTKFSVPGESDMAGTLAQRESPQVPKRPAKRAFHGGAGSATVHVLSHEAIASLQRIATGPRRPDRRPRRLGPFPARPGRGDLHRCPHLRGARSAFSIPPTCPKPCSIRPPGCAARAASSASTARSGPARPVRPTGRSRPARWRSWPPGSRCSIWPIRCPSRSTNPRRRPASARKSGFSTAFSTCAGPR